MPPRVEFDPGFDLDLAGAIEFLLKSSIARAERFADEFEVAVERMMAFPFSGSPHDSATRSARIGNGPYSIIYFVAPDGGFLRFFALAHASREPGYWRGRL